jgi:hypothetical protein
MIAQEINYDCTEGMQAVKTLRRKDTYIIIYMYVYVCMYVQCYVHAYMK